MRLYLLRHCKAGDRNAWSGPDWLRPLSNAGHTQARGLLTTLAEARFGRILSSPYVRCLESVAPIAGARGQAIEPVDALAEGSSLEEGLALLKHHGETGALCSSHGDVIPAILEHLASCGLDLGPHPRCEKGSIWELHIEAGAFVAARYIPPDASERPEA